MRLFVASVLDKKIEEKVEEWQKKFSAYPLRPIPPSNLHITLIAPWNDKDEKEASKILQEFKWLDGPIHINFDGVITKKSLAWAQIKENKKLRMLRKRLHMEFQKREEKRKHKFHATLARYKNEKVTRHMKRDMKERFQLDMTIKSIALFRSELTDLGAVYTQLADIKL